MVTSGIKGRTSVGRSSRGGIHVIRYMNEDIYDHNTESDTFPGHSL